MPFGFRTRPRLEGRGRTIDHVLTLVFSFAGFYCSVIKMREFVAVCFMFVIATKGVFGLFDSCIHGGKKYREGEYFLPNDTVIETKNPEQCVQCRCLQGLVLCEIESCPTLECETPLQNPQLCCLHCPGSLQGKDDTSSFTLGKIGPNSGSRKNTKGDCISNEKHFENGSVWQPVIGPFGVMACVQCRCQEGNIICARLECGSLVCSKPRRELGQCCPVCPNLENKKKAFCLPKSSELFVFKTANVRNNSDRIEYAFLENKWKRDQVKIHTWNLRPKKLADVFTLSVLPRKEFHKRDFRILGSVTKRGLRKYSKKGRKLRNNCFTKCLRKIERLESSLLDHAVNSRNECFKDEVDLADFCC